MNFASLCKIFLCKIFMISSALAVCTYVSSADQSSASPNSLYNRLTPDFFYSTKPFSKYTAYLPKLINYSNPTFGNFNSSDYATFALLGLVTGQYLTSLIALKDQSLRYREYILSQPDPYNTYALGFMATGALAGITARAYNYYMNHKNTSSKNENPEQEAPGDFEQQSTLSTRTSLPVANQEQQEQVNNPFPFISNTPENEYNAINMLQSEKARIKNYLKENYLINKNAQKIKIYKLAEKVLGALHGEESPTIKTIKEINAPINTINNYDVQLAKMLTHHANNIKIFLKLEKSELQQTVLNQLELLKYKMENKLQKAEIELRTTINKNGSSELENKIILCIAYPSGFNLAGITCAEKLLEKNTLSPELTELFKNHIQKIKNFLKIENQLKTT